MRITKDSHTDHALTEAHIAFLMSLFASRTAFFKETVELPAHLDALPCALHADVSDADAFHATRGTREYTSRLVRRPMTTSRLLTVIGGEHNGECILFTAFGGPSTPREPNDPTLPEAEREASLRFWSTHALSAE